jgi:hypothetical protein
MTDIPIPLTLSIPAEYTQTLPNGPILQNSSTVTFQLLPPLNIPKNSSCVLTSASFCFSQPNIAGFNDGIFNIPTGNNRVTITFGTNPTADFTIPLGLYSVTDLQFALNQIAINQGWVTSSINLFIITGISATQQVIFSLNPGAFPPTNAFPTGGITVSFINPGVNGNNDSMGPILGFPTNPASPGYTTIVAPGGGTALISVEAPDVANFANISAYNLYLSFLSGSYLNGQVGQLLYSFPLGGYTANSIVGYQANRDYPIPCQSGSYSTVNVWTTDQSGNYLPLKYYQSPFSFSCVIRKNK